MTSDPSHQAQLERLRQSVLKRWWLISLGLWLTVGPLSLWGLRHEFALLQQYFTWTAVRYGLAYNRLAALGIGITIGLSVALLVAESRHILFGLTTKERERLEKQLFKIHQQGRNHPLWSRVVEPND